MVYGWSTTTRISHRRHDLKGQRARSQGHVISLSRVGLVAHKSKANNNNGRLFNAAKQYVVIVKLVETKKKKNVQIKIFKKQIDANINAVELTIVSMSLKRAFAK